MNRKFRVYQLVSKEDSKITINISKITNSMSNAFAIAESWSGENGKVINDTFYRIVKTDMQEIENILRNASENDCLIVEE